MSLTLSAAMSSQVAIIAQVGEKSKTTGKWGNALCRITAVTFAAFVRPVNKVIFLCCTEKVNLGLDNNTRAVVFQILSGSGEEFSKFIVMRCAKSLMGVD